MEGVPSLSSRFYKGAFKTWKRLVLNLIKRMVYITIPDHNPMQKQMDALMAVLELSYKPKAASVVLKGTKSAAVE